MYCLKLYLTTKIGDNIVLFGNNNTFKCMSMKGYCY